MTDFLCRDAIAAFARHRGAGADAAIVVSTMTSIKWIGESSPSDLNISCVPLMGGASALGLGLALARPDRWVVVFDGDGSLLMQLGSLVSIAGAAPRNLTHVVFNNGVWFENMANLPVPGNGQTDYAGLAKAAGYAHARRVTSLAQWESTLPALRRDQGPGFVELVVTPESDALWSATLAQPDLPEAQFTRMGTEGRRLRAALSRQD